MAESFPNGVEEGELATLPRRVSEILIQKFKTCGLVIYYCNPSKPRAVQYFFRESPGCRGQGECTE